MFNEVSDEVKLEMIKVDLAKITYSVKMLLVIQSTLESYRQAMQGEAPQDVVDFVKSPNFIKSFYAAIQASGETVHNMLAAVDSMSMLYGVEFRTTLPTNAEEFDALVQELSKESMRLANEEKK
jgi:hypothetical protein